MCETPKSPPGDYNRLAPGRLRVGAAAPGVKHLNPRQGITTRSARCTTRARRMQRCETPKSPPGDYNSAMRRGGRSTLLFCVKHLNPRQGITTERSGAPSRRTTEACETPKSPPGDYNVNHGAPDRAVCLPQCETPKSPPGDYNRRSDVQRMPGPSYRRVKHLNPRQGITTSSGTRGGSTMPKAGVKHLNPRQGITTDRALVAEPMTVRHSVKHLNPRQGITKKKDCCCDDCYVCIRVKHLNPRQGITNLACEDLVSRGIQYRVKHLNPRQGITNPTVTTSPTIGEAPSVKHLNPRQGITNEDVCNWIHRTVVTFV